MRRYPTIAVAVIIMIAITAVVLHSRDSPAVTPRSAPTGLYVALGDSVAAGVGLKDDSDSSACNRTNQAYPHLVAAQKNYKLRNIACSGATLANGILGPQDVNKLLVPPQLDQLLAGPKPQLITLTIGANDAKWTTVFAGCYSGSCGSAADTAAVTNSLNGVTTQVLSLLSRIDAHYGTGAPRVIITGYHQVFPATAPASCTDLAGIDSSELAWGRQLQTNIGDTLRQASAAFAFARYAPVDFSGHELCTADSWVQGLQDKQPYHPTEAGQAAIAAAVMATLQK